MSTVPEFPRVVVTIHPDASGAVTIQGISYPVAPSGDLDTARQIAIGIVTMRGALALGRPVRVTAHEPAGTWPLIVHPNGDVEGPGATPAEPISHPGAAATVRLRTADGQVGSGRSLLVGRDPRPHTGEHVETLLTIRDSQRLVSKTHARIDIDAQGLVTVTDRNSTNGTEVQLHGTRRPVPGGRSMVVPTGATILLGETSLTVEVDAS